MDVSGIAADTPVVRFGRFSSITAVFAKAEYLLCTGSVYDRIAGPILDDNLALLERSPGVVAGSSNLCLSFAAAATHRGVEIKVVSSGSILPEHLLLLREHKIEVILSEASAGIAGCHRRALEVQARTSGVLLASPQSIDGVAKKFEQTLGREIAGWVVSLGGDGPSAIIAPVCSGAMLTGIGRALLGMGQNVELIGVIAAAAAGATRIPSMASRSDALSIGARLVEISDEDAMATRMELARREGALVGLGSAAAVRVAAEGVRLGQFVRPLAILVDAGDRYFSRDAVLRGGREVRS